MRIEWRVGLLAAGLALAGCDADVSLKLATSGALDAQHVRLAVSSIELTDDAGAVTTLNPDDAGINDLVDFKDGATITLLSSEKMGLAHYVKVGLTFDPTDAELVDANGDPWPITVPGSATSADVDFTLDDGDSASLFVGLDLRLSLSDRTTTSSADWRLVPRLNDVDLADEASLSGTIAKVVADSGDCLQGRTDPEGAAVYAYPQPDLTPYDESSSASPHPTATAEVLWNADGSGSYVFPHLTPGDYTVALTCEGSQDDPLVLDNLLFVDSANASLADGDVATLDFN